MAPPVAPPRALRAALAAAAAVGAAVLAHRAAHGAVDAEGAAWAFAGLVVPSWWLTGRELGLARLALVQLAGQQVAHLALVAGAGSHSALPTDLMLYAHLAAAALAAGWLRVGERRAWAAVRRVARVVLSRPAISPIPPPARPMPEPARSPVARFLRHAMARRGPPRTA